jgi:hypothetical protein
VVGKLDLYWRVHDGLGVAAESRKELECRCGYGGVGFDESVLGMRTEVCSIRLREREIIRLLCLLTFKTTLHCFRPDATLEKAIIRQREINVIYNTNTLVNLSQ